MNIFVGNLDFTIEADDLKETFEEYGHVNAVKIMTDKASGRSRGFGFVTMDNEEEGKKAIENLNNATLANRLLKVNEAQPKNSSYKKKY